MNKKWRLIHGILFSLLIFLAAVSGVKAEFFNRQNDLPEQDFVPGELLVKFKDMSLSPGPQILQGPEAEAVVAKLPAMNRFVLREIGGRTVRAFPQIGVIRVKIPAGGSVRRAARILAESGVVEYAEPNYLRYSQRFTAADIAVGPTEALAPGLFDIPTRVQPAPAQAPDQPVPATETPDDDDFPRQWALDNTGQEINGTSGAADADIDAPEAWAVRINGMNATGGAAAIAALIDSGVDYNHPDLKDNMWQDENGSHGFNALNDAADTRDPMDNEGHGTHLAGIIGAVGNNGLGVCGVNWQTRLMALKFMDVEGVGSDADAVECITYALQHKGDSRMVMNISWGGENFSRALHDAMAEARNAGVLFVAAAGNNSRNTDVARFYPAGYNLDNIIVVGASDQRDARAFFSNFGPRSVDLFAPGVNIWSTVIDGDYGFGTGTSMACPFVTGAAALIWSKDPSADYRTVKKFILRGVDKKPAFRNACVSRGRLNLYKAVSKLTGTVSQPKATPLSDPSIILRLLR
ncbi:MAG: S8 family peptidase [Deltaproteobacteria bacterium]|nr:S8 family peptidase [Deltaproteobacteria bacterium]